MRQVSRHRLIVTMLGISAIALLGTSAPAYEPEVRAALEQAVVLDGDHPVASTTVRLSTTSTTLPSGSSTHDAQLRVLAEPSRGGAELAIVVANSQEGFEERGDEIIDLRLEEVCIPGEPCEANLDISVDWVNAVSDQPLSVVMTIEAGVDYTNSLIEFARAPSDAELRLEPLRALEPMSGRAGIREQTDPETIVLTFDAPFALRQGWVELDATAARAAQGAELRADVVVTTEAADETRPRLTVWSIADGAPPRRITAGEVTPVVCPARQSCRFAYAVVAEWDGQSRSDVGHVRWAIAAVLRGDEASSATPSGALRVGVDRVMTTDSGSERISVVASGSISRDPRDPPVEVPVDPEDGPHLVEIDLRTWSPLPAGEQVGIPTTGELRIGARQENGDALEGTVRLGVVTHLPVTGNADLRTLELTPAEPTVTIILKPSLSCYDSTYGDSARPDERCSVPLDIFVQPPDEATGPVVVDWEIALTSIAPDALELSEGDLRIETGTAQ